MRILLAALFALLPLTISAQTVVGRNLAIGSSPTMPSGTTVRLDGLGTSGGTNVLFADGDGDIFERLLVKSDLPAVVGYTDEAETWSLLQTFTSGLTSNGLLTIGGSNDLLLGTGGIRVASGSINLRNIADSANIATFGDSAISLVQPVSMSSTLGVTGIATFSDRVRGVTGTAAAPSFTGTDTDTGMYFSAANTINWSTGGTLRATLTSTALTLVPDLAVNGGDITSTAANLNITPVTSVTMGGDLIMSSAHQMRSAHYASATTGWGLTYDGALDARYIYVDEMHAKAFIADLEMALNGGQIIAKSTAILAADFTCPAAGATATLRVNDFPGFPNIRTFAVNDWVVLRNFSRTDADNDGNTDLTIGDCVGQVSAYVDGSGGTEGTQQWTFTRGGGGNAGAMASSTVVNADAIVIDFGVSGQGFLIARANDGAEGANSPYWQVVTWTTSPVSANMRLQTRFGQLNGSYGYSASTYGFAAGDASDVFVAVDPTNGFRIMEGGTNQKVRIATDGSILLGQSDSTNRNVLLTNSAIALREGTSNRLYADNNGITMYDESDIARLQINSAGWLMMGRNGTGQQNTYITDSQIALRSGTSNRVVATNDQVTLYKPSGDAYLHIDAVNGLLMGDWYYADKSFIQIWPDGSQIAFCHDGGASCPLLFKGLTGNIESYGNILLGSGGNVTSTGNFTLGTTAGLRFERWAGTSYSAPRSITWANGGTTESTIGQSSNGALRLNARQSGGWAGIRLDLGNWTVSEVAPGLAITEEGTGGARLTNAVLASAAVSAGDTTAVQFVPYHAQLGATTATSKLGLSSNVWTEIHGGTFYSGGTAGFSGTKVAGACTLTIAGGIITNVTGC